MTDTNWMTICAAASSGSPQRNGCADTITARVAPSGDNRPVIFAYTAWPVEVEAYAVNPVEAEGSMGVSALAGVLKLAPGPLPGAGIRGTTTSHPFEAESGGV